MWLEYCLAIGFKNVVTPNRVTRYFKGAFSEIKLREYHNLLVPGIAFCKLQGIVGYHNFRIASIAIRQAIGRLRPITIRRPENDEEFFLL